MAVKGAELTAEKLLQATHELMLEHGGVEPSVSQLCERAGVQVAMVSYCFGGKTQLLASAARAGGRGRRRAARAARRGRDAARREAPAPRRRRDPQLRPLSVRAAAEPDARRRRADDRRDGPTASRGRCSTSTTELLRAGADAGVFRAGRPDAVLLLARRRVRVPVCGDGAGSRMRPGSGSTSG